MKALSLAMTASAAYTWLLVICCLTVCPVAIVRVSGRVRMHAWSSGDTEDSRELDSVPLDHQFAASEGKPLWPTFDRNYALFHNRVPTVYDPGNNGPD